MLDQRRPQPFEIAESERDGPASRRAAGGVREPNEAFTFVGLQELHDRREAPLTRTLRQRQLLDRLGSAPGRLARLGL
jgi:hypothetical protein